MFRITRGMHVQHIHFPLPVIRDLDGPDDDGPQGDADPPEAAPPASARESTASADAPTEETE